MWGGAEVALSRTQFTVMRNLSQGKGYLEGTKEPGNHSPPRLRAESELADTVL